MGSRAHQASQAPPPLPPQRRWPPSRGRNELPEMGAFCGAALSCCCREPWLVLTKGCPSVPHEGATCDTSAVLVGGTLLSQRLLEVASLCCVIGVAKRRLLAARSSSSCSWPLANGDIERGGLISAWFAKLCRY